MPIEIKRSVFDAYEGALPSRIAAFRRALADHALTVGVPAPIEDPLIEHLARQKDTFQVVDDDAPPGTPPRMSARQLRHWLLAHGITGQRVDEEIEALPEPLRSEAEIEWEYATVFERSHPLIDRLGPKLGFSAEEIDEAFVEAPKLWP